MSFYIYELTNVLIVILCFDNTQSSSSPVLVLVFYLKFHQKRILYKHLTNPIIAHRDHSILETLKLHPIEFLKGIRLVRVFCG